MFCLRRRRGVSDITDCCFYHKMKDILFCTSIYFGFKIFQCEVMSKSGLWCSTWSTWKSSHVENNLTLVSLLFVQSIIQESVDKTKIFTHSAFLKKTNTFTELRERAGSDCYHTHHFTTIAADNCGFLLKIEHTTPHHTTNRKPVALRGAAAQRKIVRDWLTETRHAATHGEPGAKAVL